MAWTQEQWDVFCGLIEHGWAGVFSDAAADSYRILLDDYDPVAVTGALKTLLRSTTRRWDGRPSPSELVSVLEADPSKPTFTEALRVILTVTPIHPDEAALDRAERDHPYIAAFIRTFGLGRLRVWPINDPEYGLLRRKELAEEWERFVERADQRSAHGLSLEQGEARRQLGPRKPNFAAALPAGGPPLMHAVPSQDPEPGEAP